MNRIMNEEELRTALRREFGSSLPNEAQDKLHQVYAVLGTIPQEKSVSRRLTNPTKITFHQPSQEASANSGKNKSSLVRRGIFIAVAAVLVALLGCAAYGATRLLQMQPAPADFFNESNLGVYNSLKSGVESLNAKVGETVECANGDVSLDTVSCDRNIVNLFFTLTPKQGHELNDEGNSEGSRGVTWEYLEHFVPQMQYHFSDGEQQLCEGTVSQLDAYVDGDQVKFMQRIVPLEVLPEQVDLKLDYRFLKDSGEEGWASFDVGLDLSTAPQPSDGGSQNIIFPTTQGNKELNIERFTRSELGTVMVVRNDTTDFEDGSFRLPATTLDTRFLKMTDDVGDVLNFVRAGDGLGTDTKAPFVFELSGLSRAATHVTLTPMLPQTPLQYGELPVSKPQQIDISSTGARLDVSEYGGYEITGWKVKDGVVSISLKPYGWVGKDNFSLVPVNQDPTSHVDFEKWDYVTGELVLINSYFQTSDDDLKKLVNYFYYPHPGVFNEEDTASMTIELSPTN